MSNSKKNMAFFILFYNREPRCATSRSGLFYLSEQGAVTGTGVFGYKSTVQNSTNRFLRTLIHNKERAIGIRTLAVLILMAFCYRYFIPGFFWNIFFFIFLDYYKRQPVGHLQLHLYSHHIVEIFSTNELLCFYSYWVKMLIEVRTTFNYS